jgi:hypothetical protein
LGRYFFLSYAHGDRADDQRVEDFFTELSVEIRALTGDDQDEVVGFHDFHNLRAGDAWPEELIKELCTSWTFVPLLSPRYIRSEFCGKEWAVFAQRVDAYKAETGRPAPSIIPVFWIPTSLPPALTHIHQRDPSFGAAYQTHGLRHLMRLERDREATAFVAALAKRILEVAHGFRLPPIDQRQWPDFHTVPNIFGSPVIPSPRNDSRPTPNERPRIDRPILKLDNWDSPD